MKIKIIDLLIKIGNGAMLECAYQIREVNYLIEENKIWNTLE